MCTLRGHAVLNQYGQQFHYFSCSRQNTAGIWVRAVAGWRWAASLSISNLKREEMPYGLIDLLYILQGGKVLVFFCFLWCHSILTIGAACWKKVKQITSLEDMERLDVITIRIGLYFILCVCILNILLLSPTGQMKHCTSPWLFPFVFSLWQESQHH